MTHKSTVSRNLTTKRHTASTSRRLHLCGCSSASLILTIHSQQHILDLGLDLRKRLVQKTWPNVAQTHEAAALEYRRNQKRTSLLRVISLNFLFLDSSRAFKNNQFGGIWKTMIKLNNNKNKKSTNTNTKKRRERPRGRGRGRESGRGSEWVSEWVT